MIHRRNIFLLLASFSLAALLIAAPLMHQDHSLYAESDECIICIFQQTFSLNLPAFSFSTLIIIPMTGILYLSKSVSGFNAFPGFLFANKSPPPFSIL